MLVVPETPSATGANYAGIPPVVDDRVLAPTVRALVEIVETLTGQRVNAPPQLQAVTLVQFQALERRVKALEP